jgi:hypothetical protein
MNSWYFPVLSFYYGNKYIASGHAHFIYLFNGSDPIINIFWKVAKCCLFRSLHRQLQMLLDYRSRQRARKLRNEGRTSRLMYIYNLYTYSYISLPPTTSSWRVTWAVGEIKFGENLSLYKVWALGEVYSCNVHGSKNISELFCQSRILCHNIMHFCMHNRSHECGLGMVNVIRTVLLIWTPVTKGVRSIEVGL